MKPHIQYETIPHAHPKDYADVAKSHDVLAKNELLRLLHSASCDLILDGDKLISQKKASTKITLEGYFCQCLDPQERRSREPRAFLLAKMETYRAGPVALAVYKQPFF